MKISRREFLKSSAALTLGLSALGPAPCFAAPAPATLAIRPQKRALVCIMLDGGNDSFNMLVPTTERFYADYRRSRNQLALPQSDLLSLERFSDRRGCRFGLHPAMPEVQRLFNSGRLAFVANTAPMVEPLDRNSYRTGSARLPLGLFSHADQFKHWQTAQADKRCNRGWFGTMADRLQPHPGPKEIAMNISLAGNNILQNGRRNSACTITDKGSVGLAITSPHNGARTPEEQLNAAIFASFSASLNAAQGGDPFKETWMQTLRTAQLQHEQFERATAIDVRAAFSDTELSRQLKKVVQTIRAADALGHRQQTFFLRYIGWDHHDELLNNHRRMLRVLSRALGEFQAALEQEGIADRVVTFTGSDFGRTLTSNGNGTDHAWGGNLMVLGNAVRGGRIYGDYPALTLGEVNPLDLGNGVLLPTTAIEQVYARLAAWFGVEENGMELLFPNLGRFRHGHSAVELEEMVALA